MTDFPQDQLVPVIGGPRDGIEAPAWEEYRWEPVSMHKDFPNDLYRLEPADKTEHGWAFFHLGTQK